MHIWIESGYTLILPSAFLLFFTILTLAEVFLMRLRIFFVILRRSLDENGLTEDDTGDGIMHRILQGGTYVGFFWLREIL